MRDAAGQPPTAHGSAFLAHANGLHARPVVTLTKAAKRFRAVVRIGRTADGPWIDAKSVVGVMGMKAPSGVPLFFEAAGDDAQAAVEALVALVEGDFGETTGNLPA